MSVCDIFVKMFQFSNVFFLQHVIKSITNKTPDVHQAAAYGIGAIGQFGEEVYTDFLTGRYIYTLVCFMNLYTQMFSLVGTLFLDTGSNLSRPVK